MFLDPYDTKAARAYAAKVKTISEHIERLFQLGSNAIEKQDLGYFLTPNDTTTPPFGHPLKIELHKDSCYVMDVRSFTRLNAQRDIVIASPFEYRFAGHRLALQTIWAKESPRLIWNLGTFQMTIFARWVSENIRRNMAIEPETQLNVAIIAAYYYFCMCDDTTDERYDEEDMYRICSIIARSTFSQSDYVHALIGEEVVCRSVDNLIEMIKRLGGSLRLSRFSVENIYSILGGTWFGSNYREIVGIAIEHPPTFVAMLYNALNDRGVKKSGLATVALTLEKSPDSRAFTANFIRLLAKEE